MVWPDQDPPATDVLLHLNVPCAGGIALVALGHWQEGRRAGALLASVLDTMLTSIHCLGLGYAAPLATPLQQFVVRPRGHL